MELNYRYQKNGRIEGFLRRIEIAKGIIEFLPELPNLEKNLRRKSLLKSSLFSARIEGNRLNYEGIRFEDGRLKTTNVEKIEVFNIFKALSWIYSLNSPKRLTESLILKLHKMVMKNLFSPMGAFRKESSAIFNQAGVAIYLPPSPLIVPSLMKKLIEEVNYSKESFPVKAAIFHFSFEKIHPFLDGNGRVGRLLATFILKQGRFDFRGLLSLDEYLEKNRESYYQFLAISKKNITPFVEFFLEAIAEQAEKTIASLKDIDQEREEDSLLPRRREILEIIKDHQIVSFDFISRRFSKIAPSTLHYDLSKLMREGFIKKLGSTRGARYLARDST